MKPKSQDVQQHIPERSRFPELKKLQRNEVPGESSKNLNEEVEAECQIESESETITGDIVPAPELEYVPPNFEINSTQNNSWEDGHGFGTSQWAYVGIDTNVDLIKEQFGNCEIEETKPQIRVLHLQNQSEPNDSTDNGLKEISCSALEIDSDDVSNVNACEMETNNVQDQLADHNPARGPEEHEGILDQYPTSSSLLERIKLKPRKVSTCKGFECNTIPVGKESRIRRTMEEVDFGHKNLIQERSSKSSSSRKRKSPVSNSLLVKSPPTKKIRSGSVSLSSPKKNKFNTMCDSSSSQSKRQTPETKENKSLEKFKRPGAASSKSSSSTKVKLLEKKSKQHHDKTKSNLKLSSNSVKHPSTEKTSQKTSGSTGKSISRKKSPTKTKIMSPALSSSSKSKQTEYQKYPSFGDTLLSLNTMYNKPSHTVSCLTVPAQSASSTAKPGPSKVNRQESTKISSACNISSQSKKIKSTKMSDSTFSLAKPQLLDIKLTKYHCRVILEPLLLGKNSAKSVDSLNTSGKISSSIVPSKEKVKSNSKFPDASKSKSRQPALLAKQMQTNVKTVETVVPESCLAKLKQPESKSSLDSTKGQPSAEISASVESPPQSSEITSNVTFLTSVEPPPQSSEIESTVVRPPLGITSKETCLISVEPPSRSMDTECEETSLLSLVELRTVYIHSDNSSDTVSSSEKLSLAETDSTNIFASVINPTTSPSSLHRQINSPEVCADSASLQPYPAEIEFLNSSDSISNSTDSLSPEIEFTSSESRSCSNLSPSPRNKSESSSVKTTDKKNSARTADLVSCQSEMARIERRTSEYSCPAMSAKTGNTRLTLVKDLPSGVYNSSRSSTETFSVDDFGSADKFSTHDYIIQPPLLQMYNSPFCPSPLISRDVRTHTTAPVNDDGSKRVLCPAKGCSLTFLSKNSLRKHRRVKHTNKKRK